jgi:hypothetical protein
MKVKLGMRVSGDCAEGTVIAMTNEWCIYKTDKVCSDGTWELAEPWDCISVMHFGPEETPAGSLQEKER